MNLPIVASAPPAALVISALGIPVLYVASLYVLVPASIRSKPRNDPQHIRARALGVTAATCVAIVASAVVLPPHSDAWVAAGIDPRCWSGAAIFAPVLLFLLVHSGGILVAIADECTKFIYQSNGGVSAGVAGRSTSSHELAYSAWLHFVVSFVSPATSAVRAATTAAALPQTLRDLLLAPVTEEISLRSLPLALYAGAGLSPGAAIAASAGAFAVAHLHHLRERLRRGDNFADAAAAVAMQLVMTGAFGTVAAVSLLATRALPGVVLLHAVANAFGLPSSSGRLRRDDGARGTWCRAAATAAVSGGIVAGFVVGYLYAAAAAGSGPSKECYGWGWKTAA